MSASSRSAGVFAVSGGSLRCRNAAAFRGCGHAFEVVRERGGLAVIQHKPQLGPAPQYIIRADSPLAGDQPVNLAAMQSAAEMSAEIIARRRPPEKRERIGAIGCDQALGPFGRQEAE